MWNGSKYDWNPFVYIYIYVYIYYFLCDKGDIIHSMNHTYHLCIRIREWLKHSSMENTLEEW